MEAPSRRRLVFLILFLVLAAAVALWLRGRLKRPLVAALRKAGRVEVAARALLSRGDEEPAPFVLRGRDKVEALLAMLDFELSVGWFHCMCSGDTVIEFYDGGVKLATLTYHHGTHMRWQSGPWDTDVFLTQASQMKLAEWFSDQGYHRLLVMRQEELATQKREDDETARFSGYMAASRAGGGSGKETAKAVFLAFSATSLSWSVTGEKERRAIGALSSVSDAELLTALPEIVDDRRALLGFARFYFSDGYDRKVPESERTEWTLRLADVVLAEGLDGDKPRAMRSLRALSGGDVNGFLRSVLDGKYTNAARADGAWTGEPGLNAEAALCLALRGDGSVKDRIVELLDGELTRADRAALEIALAALGDPSYLKNEHFSFGSYSIGFAGLDVIEDYGGAYGMDALVYGAFEHPWAPVGEEAVLVFERLTGHVVWNRARGGRASWYAKDAAAWWKENGARFVTSRRAVHSRQEPR